MRTDRLKGQGRAEGNGDRMIAAGRRARLDIRVIVQAFCGDDVKLAGEIDRAGCRLQEPLRIVHLNGNHCSVRHCYRDPGDNLTGDDRHFGRRCSPAAGIEQSLGQGLSADYVVPGPNATDIESAGRVGGCCRRQSARDHRRRRETLGGRRQIVIDDDARAWNGKAGIVDYEPGNRPVNCSGGEGKDGEWPAKDMTS